AGRVASVVLDNGQRIAAPLVISNADPLQTCEELVGAEHFDPAYIGRLHWLRPSLSAAVLFLATDQDLDDVAHETFMYDHWDHDETYRRMLAGELPALAVTVPTLSDPSQSRNGHHLITASALVPYGATTSWRRSKPMYQKLMLDKLGTLLPG